MGYASQDHARISVSVAPDILKHLKPARTAEVKRRLRLEEWRNATPQINAAVVHNCLSRMEQLDAGEIDAAVARADTMRERQQAAESILLQPHRADPATKGRRPHRNHRQIVLTREIARAKAALNDGTSLQVLTRAQELCLIDAGFTEELLVSNDEALRIVNDAAWTALLRARIKTRESELQRIDYCQNASTRRRTSQSTATSTRMNRCLVHGWRPPCTRNWSSSTPGFGPACPCSRPLMTLRAK